jgi:hypothetical protein
VTLRTHVSIATSLTVRESDMEYIISLSVIGFIVCYSYFADKNYKSTEQKIINIIKGEKK